MTEQNGLTPEEICGFCKGYGKYQLFQAEDIIETKVCPVCDGTGKAKLAKVNTIMVGDGHPEERVPMYRPELEKELDQLLKSAYILGKLHPMRRDDFKKELLALIPDRLDRPERDKIARVFLRYSDWADYKWEELSSSTQNMLLGRADQINVFIPDIERAKKEERERIVELYTRHHETQSPKDMKSIMLEDGKP